jgi:RHS repeat-associated protein
LISFFANSSQIYKDDFYYTYNSQNYTNFNQLIADIKQNTVTESYHKFSFKGNMYSRGYKAYFNTQNLNYIQLGTTHTRMNSREPSSLALEIEENLIKKYSYYLGSVDGVSQYLDCSIETEVELLDADGFDMNTANDAVIYRTKLTRYQLYTDPSTQDKSCYTTKSIQVFEDNNDDYRLIWSSNNVQVPYTAYTGTKQTQVCSTNVTSTSSKSGTSQRGNPCDVFTGNKIQHEVDYQSKYLNLVRVYNSEQNRDRGFTLGNGWKHNFDSKILTFGVNQMYGAFEYIDKNNKIHYFSQESTGIYYDRTQENVTAKINGDEIIINFNGEIRIYDRVERFLKKIKYSTHTITVHGGDNPTKVSNNFGDEILFHYMNGSLASVTLPNGNIIHYSQDATIGNLITVTYPDNKYKIYHYEDLNFTGYLTGITDENNIRYATWEYDANGKAISSEHKDGYEKVIFGSSRTTATNSKGHTENFASLNDDYTGIKVPRTYTSNGNTTSHKYWGWNKAIKTEQILPNNLKTTQTVTGNKKVISRLSDGEIPRTTDFGYTSYKYGLLTVGEIKNQIINDLYQIDLIFDDAMRTTSKTITDLSNHTIPYATNGRIRTVLYTYGTNGLVKAIDGARTDVNDFTFIDYDGFGNVTQIKNALCHNLTSIDDYDSTLTENANCQKIQFGNYNADHQPQLMIDINGVNTVLTYDLRNRLKTSSVQYSTGTLTTTYDYDGVGQLDKVTLPDGSWLDYDFNGARYLTKVTNSLGETIEFTHDTEGMITNRVIKSASGTITNQFNQVWTIDNKLEKFISGEGFETSYTYDVMDQVSSVTDHLSNIVSFERDLYSQITKEIDPLLDEVTRTYDQSGNVTTVTDQRGNTTTYTVDGFGQTIRLVSPDAGTENYWRDEAGNITKKSNANTVVEYNYDVLNRLTFIDYLDDTLDTTFTYDVGANAKGKMSGVVYKHGSINFTYDGFGQVEDKTSLINGVFNTTTYNRDIYGRLDSMVYPSGMILNYTYDSLGRLDKITMQANSGGVEVTIVENIDYLPFGGIKSYDYGNGMSFSADFNLDYSVTNVTHNNGLSDLFSETYDYRKLHQIDSITDNLNALNNQSFTFDTKDQLIGANGVYGDYDYGYDAVGNRTNKTVDLTTIEDYTIEPLNNRLSDVVKGLETRSFGYDDLGNVTSDNGFDSTLTLLDYADNNRLIKATVGGVEFDYGYNPFGQRIIDNGKTNQFDQSGNLIHVQDGATTVEYIYIGQTKVAMVKDGVVYYTHNNYMGLPRLYTDSSMNVVWSGEFKPFGELFNENGQVSNWVRFIGQWENVETDYFYNYFRDYDPTLGRYLQSDPIGLNAGVNTYTYVLNDPINGIDPFGLYVVYGSNVSKENISNINALLEILGSIDPNVKSLISDLKNHHKKIIITTNLNEVTKVKNEDDCNISINLNLNTLRKWSANSGYTLLNVTVHELQHAWDFAHDIRILSYNGIFKKYPNSLEDRADKTMNSFVKKANKLGWGLSERDNYYKDVH